MSPRILPILHLSKQILPGGDSPGRLYHLGGAVVAKRFTDTGKWEKLWYRKLSLKMRSAWEFILCKCDYAGIWEVDVEILSTYIGAEVSLPDLKKAFEDRLRWFDKDRKVFVEGFVEFQYGHLGGRNNMQKSIISRLNKYDLLSKKEPLDNPSSTPIDTPPQSLEGVKDQEQVQVQDQVQEQEKEPELLKPELFEPKETDKLLAVVEEWGKTLKHHGIEKDPRTETKQLSSLMKSYGYERTLNALKGFRFEKRDGDYDPSKYCYLGRLKKKFDYLENLGAGGREGPRVVKTKRFD